MGKLVIPENKVLEWIVIGVSGVVMATGLAAPLILFFLGSSPLEWGWFSWEPYLIMLGVVMYTVGLGVVRKKLRKR